MKKVNRQNTPSLGISTKKNNAGLSLPTPPLFETIGNTFIYYNETPFIARLKRIKFKFVRFSAPFSFFISFGKIPKIIKSKTGRHLFQSVEHHPFQPSLF